MPYTAEKPGVAPSRDELRQRVPGWGVDLDPADRPSVPQEREADPALGEIACQPGGEGRERSIEHLAMTPVFGTRQPTRGVSGVIRRYAYRSFGEGRAAHWLLLMAADRIDVLESRLGRPPRDQ
jgi:hypothetical protein